MACCHMYGKNRSSFSNYHSFFTCIQSSLSYYSWIASNDSFYTSAFFVYVMYSMQQFNPYSNDMTMLYNMFNFGFLILQIFLIWLTINYEFMCMIIILFLKHLKVFFTSYRPRIMDIYSAAPLVILLPMQCFASFNFTSLWYMIAPVPDSP